MPATKESEKSLDVIITETYSCLRVATLRYLLLIWQMICQVSRLAIWWFIIRLEKNSLQYVDKVHIFWEGHKILWNLHRRFDYYYRDFQSLDLIITEFKSHMTCYNSMPLIGWNYSIETGEKILQRIFFFFKFSTKITQALKSFPDQNRQTKVLCWWDDNAGLGGRNNSNRGLAILPCLEPTVIL